MSLVLVPESRVADRQPSATDPVEAQPRYSCDGCGQTFEGEPAGSGLFMWTRGEEVRFEEPPLCEECAGSVTLDALSRWDIEEEEEG